MERGGAAKIISVKQQIKYLNPTDALPLLILFTNKNKKFTAILPPKAKPDRLPSHLKRGIIKPEAETCPITSI
jgi:hypothetical protein